MTPTPCSVMERRLSALRPALRVAPGLGALGLGALAYIYMYIYIYICRIV